MGPVIYFTTIALQDVWVAPSGNVYIVGARCAIGWYDGTSWDGMSGSCAATWYGIWGSDDDDIYVVGSSGGSIYHFDGMDWSPIRSLAPDHRAIWGFSADNIYIVGVGCSIWHYGWE